MPSEILLPEGIDLTKWACIACDQHTKEEEYFETLEKFVGDSPSAYRIVFPEIFLGADDEKRIKTINDTMRKYLADCLFKRYDGYILTVRTTSSGETRVGIVLSVNLDDYSFEKKSDSLIRATEGTVKERIPARVRIRENAPLELPHVMLLANDEDKSVIEPLYAKRAELKKVYDFDLNMGGGKIEGYFVPKSIDVASMFEKTEKNGLLFAVGDGNHSLAAAKTVWENKKEGAKADDPARYALVEVVNLYSPAINFKPIHRLLIGVDANKIIGELKNNLSGNGELPVYSNGEKTLLTCPENTVECYRTVQDVIDNCLAKEKGEVDYIHGDEVLKKLSATENSVGILMPGLKKQELFPAVEKFGSLPRKTFSMGEADDKRFYLEARKITR